MEGLDPIPIYKEPPKKPFWKNPWFLAFVAGAIGLTLIRPFMRRVPDPPPVLAPLPAFNFQDLTGAAAGSERLRGQTTVLAVLPLDGPRGAHVAAAMTQLKDLFARDHINARVALFFTDASLTRTQDVRGFLDRFRLTEAAVQVFVAPPESVRLWALGSLLPILPDPSKLFHDAGTGEVCFLSLIIVDRDLGVRGFYGIDPEGVDEVYYRTQHVMNEKRS